ncbi:MAG TPA: hypothetical protein VGP13_02530 [Candidatus Paceibacterota bacterium]|jgi:hypothetical protein|nr:hypothetical protein [Candidatus Paceibacterota bacterium]
MLSKHDRLRLGRTLLRELWQKYDAGGESMRSGRSQLLERATVWLWPLKPEDFPLPKVFHSEDYFEGLGRQKLEEFDPITPPPRTLEEVPVELYALLVVHVLIFSSTGEESIVEKKLLEHALRLLYRKEIKFLLRTGKVNADSLREEALRRSMEKYESEY